MWQQLVSVVSSKTATYNPLTARLAGPPGGRPAGGPIARQVNRCALKWPRRVKTARVECVVCPLCACRSAGADKFDPMRSRPAARPDPVGSGRAGPAG